MDSRGKETKGTLECASQNEAIGRVKEMELFPTKIVEIDKAREKPVRKGAPYKGSGQEEKGRRRQYQHQDSRPERKGKIKDSCDFHTPVGHAGGRRPAVAPWIARPGKAGEESHAQKDPRRSGAVHRRRQHILRRLWRNTRKYSIVCSSTWSRRVNWAVCWKSC